MMIRIELHSPADKQLASDLLTRFKTTASSFYIGCCVVLLSKTSIFNFSTFAILQSFNRRTGRHTNVGGCSGLFSKYEQC